MARTGAPVRARRAPTRARLTTVFVVAVLAVAGVTFGALSVLVDSDDDSTVVVTEPVTTAAGEAGDAGDASGAPVPEEAEPSTPPTAPTTRTDTTLPAPSTTTTALPSMPVTLEWESPCVEQGPALGSGAASLGSAATAEIGPFGPLGPGPSLTVELPMLRRLEGSFNGEPGGLVRPHVTTVAVAGGVVVIADGIDEGRVAQALVALVGTGGEVGWIRCVPGLVAAWHGGRSLLVRTGDPLVGIPHRWAWWSLADGTELEPLEMPDPSFFEIEPPGGAGPFEVDQLGRWLLLLRRDRSSGAVDRLARVDLVEQRVEQIALSADVATAAASGRTAAEMLPDGAVLQVASVGVPAHVWRNGSWLDDPASMKVVPTHVEFDVSDVSEVSDGGPSLVGVNDAGGIVWERPDLGTPGLEGSGIWIDGQTAIVHACVVRDPNGECTRHDLLGVDIATGATRWAQQGFRLVAGGPADGAVLVSTARDGTAIDGFDGWKMIDVLTAATVPNQNWLGPDTFAVGCCGDGLYRHTTRTGGVVVVANSPLVHVWLPEAASVPTVTVSLIGES
jgi:hypothetical protein